MGELLEYEVDYTVFLGQGAFGTVYKAQHRETGQLVAAKRIIVKYDKYDKSEAEAVESEIELCKMLGEKHENIIELIKTQELEVGIHKHFWIVTELCSLGDLVQYARDYYLTTGNRLDIMLQSARALEFMHSRNPPVIHRDVKPANILMKEITEEEVTRYVVKLADFGLARTFSNANSRSVETMSAKGTVCYMAPELLDEIYWPKDQAQHRKDGAQDSWSHGLVSYQLLSSDPRNGIDCPEVTDITIARVMIITREIDADIEQEKKQWEIEIRRDTGLPRKEKDAYPHKGMEDKIKSMKKELAIREKTRRIELWMRSIPTINRMEPTKDWNPIIIQDSDSDVVKEAKQLIQTQVQFDPRERSTMAQVVEQLEDIIKMLPAPPTMPRLTTHEEKDLVKSQQPATDKEKSLQEPDFTCKTVPEMVKCFSHQLGFKISRISCSSDCVVGENIDKGKIVKYVFNVNIKGKSGYSKVWEKPLPAGVRSGSGIFVLSNSNIVFRHRDDNVTVVCDGDLNPKYTHTGDYGELYWVVHGEKLLYLKQSGSYHSLDVYDYKSHQHVCRLPVSVRSEYISIASHPASGWFVLTDRRDETMYMFTSDYQLHTQVQLRFRPRSTNAVCCVGELVAVVSVDGYVINWYNWSGERVYSVRWQEMGVEGQIWGVGDGGEGRMQVYTHNYDHDSKAHKYYLYMFKVESITRSIGGAVGGASK